MADTEVELFKEASELFSREMDYYIQNVIFRKLKTQCALYIYHL